MGKQIGDLYIAPRISKDIYKVSILAVITKIKTIKLNYLPKILILTSIWVFWKAISNNLKNKRKKIVVVWDNKFLILVKKQKSFTLK